ncbi:MAG: hypothetical protein V4568_18065 [Pseudomonadota bacterium]
MKKKMAEKPRVIVKSVARRLGLKSLRMQSKRNESRLSRTTKLVVREALAQIPSALTVANLSKILNKLTAIPVEVAAQKIGNLQPEEQKELIQADVHVALNENLLNDIYARFVKHVLPKDIVKDLVMKDRLPINEIITKEIEKNYWKRRKLIQFLNSSVRFDQLPIMQLFREFWFDSHVKCAEQSTELKLTTMTILNHWKFGGYVKDIMTSITGTLLCRQNDLGGYPCALRFIN